MPLVNIDLKWVKASYINGVPSAESSRFVRGLGKGVSGKPYPRLCNARRPRLEPRTFRPQVARLYRLHQTRPSKSFLYRELNYRPKRLVVKLSVFPFCSGDYCFDMRNFVED